MWMILQLWSYTFISPCAGKKTAKALQSKQLQPCNAEKILFFSAHLYLNFETTALGSKIQTKYASP